MAEAYFSQEALRFLRALKRNNDREWFAEHKGTFERELRAPALALIGTVNEAMLRFAPEHVRPPEKTLMRIYRDIRFSKDKRPYKIHLSAWWARQGLAKTSGAGFYFDVSGTEMTIAAGVYMPEREQLLAIRRHLVEHHAGLRSLLRGKRLRALMAPSDGHPLTRPPKGFGDAEPAMDLLLCRQWGVTCTMPAEKAIEPGLAGELIRRFELAAPLVHFLNAPLSVTRRSPLF